MTSGWAADVFDLVLCAVSFFIARVLEKRFKTPLTAPTLTASFIIVTVLLYRHTSYGEFMRIGQFVNDLLGPATVALAIPLYRNRAVLGQYALAVLGGISAGAVVGMISGVLLARLFHMPTLLIRSLLPKNVTTPIAMGVSQIIHGSPELTAVFVMIAGNTGYLLGPWILRRVRITEDLARGLGMGTASHGIGTAKSLQTYGELSGACASLAIAVAGTVTALLAPILARWLVP